MENAYENENEQNNWKLLKISVGSSKILDLRISLKNHSFSFSQSKSHPTHESGVKWKQKDVSAFLMNWIIDHKLWSLCSKTRVKLIPQIVFHSFSDFFSLFQQSCNYNTKPQVFIDLVGKFSMEFRISSEIRIYHSRTEFKIDAHFLGSTVHNRKIHFVMWILFCTWLKIRTGALE